jgi:hypothetical protein
MNQIRINSTLIALTLVVCIAMIGVAEKASALMLEMSPEELTSGADAIVIGQVVDRNIRWNLDKSHIFTLVVISTEERLKGSIRSNNLIIAVQGGKIGDTTEEVTDVPNFSVGEKVVIFIRPITDKQLAKDGLTAAGDERPWFQVHGGFQGKFSVRDDKVGNSPLIKFKERILKALTSGIPATPDRQEMPTSEFSSSIGAISGITPSSASAGTNSMITITGDNFGQPTGTPYFYYKSNEYYGCSSCVTSWTDSDVMVKVPIFTASDSYPASAGSGPVYLMSSAGVKSDSFPFSVTFSYGGIKWMGASPIVEFKVNPNGDDALRQAVQDAADTWNAVSNKRFSFKYAGPTSTAKTSMNKINEIIWANLPPGVIGQASMLSFGGYIRECDIKFNILYRWSTNATTPKDAMDVHTIALHELGHWLSLRDLYGNVSGYPTDTAKVMYGYGGNGTQKRNLTTDDSFGIRYIYPAENPCAASLSLSGSAYDLFVPTVNTTPNTWADLQYDPASSTNTMFRLINSGENPSPDAYKACQPSTLSMSDGNYVLHIPELIYGGVSYRLDLTHVPTTDGLTWFVLSGIWAN